MNEFVPGTVIPLSVSVTREGVAPPAGGIGGLVGADAPVAAIERAADGFYLDFADNTFKAVGWVTKYATLVESERGFYLFLWTTPLMAAGTRLLVQYYVQAVGIIFDGDEEDLWAVDIPVSAGAVWDELSAAHVGAGTMGLKMQFLDASVAGVPAAVDVTLSAAHGAGSWQTAVGFAVPGDAMTLTAPTIVTITSASASAVWDELETSHVTLGTMGWDMNSLRRGLTNRLHASPGNPGTLNLWDDDDVAVWFTWQSRDYLGGAVVGVAGNPARRAKAT